MNRHLFLVGFMGSGKSAVGRQLADLLGRPWVDTDHEVEAHAGARIAQIFLVSGEASFRTLEREVLDGLAALPPSVVSTGGGLMLCHANRLRLRELGTTIWLDVPAAVVERRLGLDVSRPLWSGLDPDGRRALFERRRALYALADLRVAAGSAEPAEVARWVAGKLRG